MIFNHLLMPKQYKTTMKPALFERIQEEPVSKYNTVDDLYDSIFQEILCILDRQSISSLDESNIQSKLSYINPYSKGMLSDFSSRIQYEIEEYEPRLLNPIVSIDKFDDKKCSVQVKISGMIEFEDEVFGVNFGPLSNSV